MLRDALRTRSSYVLVAALACFSFTAFSNPAQADLFFNNILSYQAKDTNIGSTTPVNFLVNATSINDPPEINLAGANVVPGTLTVTDHLLYFKYGQAANFDTATFNGYIIRDVSTGIPPITSVTVDPISTLAGLNQSRITFDATDIFINVSGLSVKVGTVFQIDVNQAAVPEPGPLALIAVAGFASGALAWVRRRAGRSLVSAG